MIASAKVAQLVASLALERKAQDVVILEMARVSPICDFFVIVSAASGVRARTIADHVEQYLKSQGVRLGHREGYREGVWILMDYGDIVVHIFQTEARRYYRLDSLWGDAPRHALKDEHP